jgi:hypothetical protein
MKGKSFNNLLLFSLFGITLGFFGMLYEGVVTIPKMLDTSMARMIFWKDYYAAINPMVYYIPITPLATVILAVLFFRTGKENAALRNRLGWAVILQIAALAITFYIVKIINPKMYFNNITQYADVIPAKTVLVNILSVVRLALCATAVSLTFKSYVETQKNLSNEKE